MITFKILSQTGTILEQDSLPMDSIGARDFKMKQLREQGFTIIDNYISHSEVKIWIRTFQY